MSRVSSESACGKTIPTVGSEPVIPGALSGDNGKAESLLFQALCEQQSHAGGGTRTPDTRIMIPLL
jgi:hypothetical protein